MSATPAIPATPAAMMPETPFIERRESSPVAAVNGHERRQFSNSHEHLSPDASELATAIDQYKMQHRRRFINFEEMLSIMKSLGYHK